MEEFKEITNNEKEPPGNRIFGRKWIVVSLVIICLGYFYYFFVGPTDAYQQDQQRERELIDSLERL